LPAMTRYSPWFASDGVALVASANDGGGGDVAIRSKAAEIRKSGLTPSHSTTCSVLSQEQGRSRSGSCRSQQYPQHDGSMRIRRTLSPDRELDLCIAATPACSSRIRSAAADLNILQIASYPHSRRATPGRLRRAPGRRPRGACAEISRFVSFRSLNLDTSRR